MRKRWVRVSQVIVGAALFVAGSASAARAQERVVATVPFPFIVGNTELAAGSYSVEQPFDDPSIIWIKSTDGRHVASTLTIAGSARSRNPQSALVFEKFEGQYFLQRVTGDDGSERDIILTPAHMQQELVTVTSNNP